MFLDVAVNCSIYCAGDSYLLSKLVELDMHFLVVVTICYHLSSLLMGITSCKDVLFVLIHDIWRML